MAIDSAAKRKSAASVAGVPWMPGVTPDAAKPVSWRQQAAWGYAGVAAAPTTAHTVTGTWEVPSRTGSWEVSG